MASEAAARETLDRLLGDCMVLLEHLTGAVDARLDWCFEETRARSAGTPPARIAAPPSATKTKAEFLERLTALGARLADPAGYATITPGEIAFLIAARDFLSTLARPVTVETIRITREYVRPARPFRDLWRWLRGLGDTPPTPPLRSERFGRSLAFQVSAFQLCTLALVVLTVWISIYALVGRGLVLEVRSVDEQFAALGTDLAKAEAADASLFLQVGDGGNNTRALRPEWQHYCDMGRGEKNRSFITPQHQRLCDRYEGYNEKFLILFRNLDQWRDRWPGQLIPGMNPPDPLPAKGFAPRDKDDNAVRAVADAAETNGTKPRSSTEVLQAVQQHRLAMVNAEVVLRAIAEYLLPCLYAMLGALAASLRHIARRVEECTLDFTDGGVITRTLVLGVLFGAVIGLFSSQLAPAIEKSAGAAASLTPAALSLLAGYSVAQVFQFFDGLAQRVFGPRPAAAPAG